MASPMSRPRMMTASQTARGGKENNLVSSMEFAMLLPCRQRGLVNSRGRAPLTASAMVSTVMRVLSAMGSMTDPTTVPRFQRRAIQPSSRSVMPGVREQAEGPGMMIVQDAVSDERRGQQA